PCVADQPHSAGQVFEVDVDYGHSSAAESALRQPPLGADEVANARLNLVPKTAAVENAVMPDARLDIVLPALVGQTGREVLSRPGLAAARDVVLLALDRHQADIEDRLRPDQPV